jgi:hypothetical protein
MKLSEISFDEYVAQVVAFDDEVSQGILRNNLDVKPILEEQYARAKAKYSLATGVAIGVNVVKAKIRECEADKFIGLLVGMKDRADSNRPISLMLVRSDGDHKEVGTWRYRVQCGTEKIDLPIPSKVVLNCTVNSKYNSIGLESIDTYTPVSKGEAVTNLRSVAVPPSELTEDHLYKVVVVRGKISAIRPATVFVDKKPAGFHPVLVENQRDDPLLVPVCQIELETDDHKVVKLAFEPQRFGCPTFMVDDFVDLTNDANETTSIPNDQVEMMKYGLIGREVLGVGVVTRVAMINQRKGKRRERLSQKIADSAPTGPSVTYIDISCGGIYDYGPIGAGVVSSIDDTPRVSPREPTPMPEVTTSKVTPSEVSPTIDSPSVSPVVESPPVTSPVPSLPTSAPSMGVEAEEAESPSKRRPIDKVMDSIQRYCRMLDLGYDEVSSDKLKQSIFPADDDVTEMIIDAALDMIRAERVEPMLEAAA